MLLKKVSRVSRLHNLTPHLSTTCNMHDKTTDMNANTFVLLIIIFSLVGVLFLLVKVWRIVNGKDRYTYSEKKTIDMYGRLPKAGDKKMLLLTIVLMSLIAASCSPKGTLNCGSTYKLNAPKFKA
jgi:hypothetical protein